MWEQWKGCCSCRIGLLNCNVAGVLDIIDLLCELGFLFYSGSEIPSEDLMDVLISIAFVGWCNYIAPLQCQLLLFSATLLLIMKTSISVASQSVASAFMLYHDYCQP